MIIWASHKRRVANSTLTQEPVETEERLEPCNDDGIEQMKYNKVVVILCYTEGTMAVIWLL